MATRSAPSGKPAFLRSASPISLSAIGPGAHLRLAWALGKRGRSLTEGIIFETITTSSPSISSAGRRLGSSPAWKTTIETMSVAAGRRRGVSIFAGHLFGSCLGGGGPSPRDRTHRPDWLTSPGAFGSSESTRRHGLARSPTPRGLISKTGFGARKGMASGGWCPNVRSRLSR